MTLFIVYLFFGLITSICVILIERNIKPGFGTIDVFIWFFIWPVFWFLFVFTMIDIQLKRLMKGKD